MAKSMTGFGRGECMRFDRKIKIEIKSVNHRYCDISFRLPRFLNFLEDSLRKKIARDIARGKVEVWINFESYTERDMAVKLNIPFADAYMEALEVLNKRYGFGDAPSLASVIRNPDLFNVERNEIGGDTYKEIVETLDAALETALREFNAMRDAEGQFLTTDIRLKGKRIKELHSLIKERAPAAAEEHNFKVRERAEDFLNKFNVQADEGRLLTEIALLAERYGIDEELIRLDSHLSQLDIILNEKEPVGRKLDFLVQEFNREANTIGSKSSDALLSKYVVDLKSEIEKIREQVQNLE